MATATKSTLWIKKGGCFFIIILEKCKNQERTGTAMGLHELRAHQEVEPAEGVPENNRVLHHHVVRRQRLRVLLHEAAPLALHSSRQHCPLAGKTRNPQMERQNPVNPPKKITVRKSLFVF